MAATVAASLPRIEIVSEHRRAHDAAFRARVVEASRRPGTCVLVRDERPWGSDAAPVAFYRYSADRLGLHAETLLAGCRGFLHADGYAGFGKLYQPTTPTGEAALIEVACWSHARRKFYDVHQATTSPIALEALQQSSRSRRCSPSRAKSAADRLIA